MPVCSCCWSVWNCYSSQAGFYILQNNRSIIIFPMLGEFPQSKTRSITQLSCVWKLVMFVKMEGNQAGAYFFCRGIHFFRGHSLLHTDQLLYTGQNFGLLQNTSLSSTQFRMHQWLWNGVLETAVILPSVWVLFYYLNHAVVLVRIASDIVWGTEQAHNGKIHFSDVPAL